tara:strand:+ start:161 stop:463 length:303 start_codon:yes stop_codon:yes gene_type:complete
MLDFSRTWIPYIYLYGVGGGIFLIGLFIILRSRSLKPERVRHKGWYRILIFGFFYYMGIHGFFTFAAIGETMFAALIGLIMIAMTANLIFTLVKKSKGVG